jgi:flagellar hook-associated protein 2
MMDVDSIKATAQNLADYEIRRALLRVQRNQGRVKTQLDGMNALDTALKALNTAVKGIKSADKGMLVNSATFNKPEYATATAGATAQAGNYEFFVEQLASSHRLAVKGLQESDLGSGVLTLTQDGKSFDVDMTGVTTQEQLAAKINAASDNTGLKAMLVRNGSDVSLVLSSDKPGEAQAISMTTSGATSGFDAALAGRQELSAAQDAVAYLGSDASGLRMTSSSNTFDNVIEGVSVTFNKVHSAGEAPLALEIDQDKSATKESAQNFVNAINALLTSFDSLTASGGGEDGARGSLAGDASVRSIESLLGNLLRGDYGGANLMQFGIAADAKGKLTIDTKRFEAGIVANPEAFEKLFTGKGNLLDSIDKQLSAYTNSSGMIKSRKDSLDQQMRRTEAEHEKIEKQHEMFYQRYLKQYTNMSLLISQMESTYGLF